MKVEKNIIITGSAAKPIALDIFFEETGRHKSVIIYAHGFNGFKDWGNFDLIAKQFASQGFVFVKFNFSHNGTTPEHPEEFVDLEAFGQNNYTKELNDLNAVIDWCCDDKNMYKSDINQEQIYLLGHSMGGGITIIAASEDSRIKKLATWASICECKTPWGNWPEDKMKEWEENGVQYITNGRTGQQMPLQYQLHTDYELNKIRLNIQQAITSLNIPILICHGTKDDAVPLKQAEQLQHWHPTARLFTVESDHVFGRKHPWTAAELPQPMQSVVDETISFFKEVY